MSLTYDEAFQPQPRTYIYVRAFMTDSEQSVFITQRYYTGLCVTEISKDLRISLRTYWDACYPWCYMKQTMYGSPGLEY